MTETRSEALARWELMGWLEPGCPGCRVFYDSPAMPFDVHEPRHRASSGCESGCKTHGTCEMCW
jgi:hypothetical protein